MTPTNRSSAGEKRLDPGWVPDADSLHLLAQLADVAWFWVDRDRTVVAMSPAMEELTGLPASEALGRPCIYLSRCHECLRKCGVFAQGRVKNHPLTLYDSAGVEIPVVKSGQVFRDSRGRITGALEVVQPVTNGEAVEGNGDGEASEAGRIIQALRDNRYNRTLAAQELGISRTTLWRRMKDYDL